MQEQNIKREKGTREEDVVSEALSDSHFDSEMGSEDLRGNGIMGEMTEESEIREETGEEVENGALQEDGVGAPQSEHKHGAIGRRCKVVAKVFFSFVFFVAALAAIGFGVLWLIDHEQSLKFWEKDEKQPVEEVFMHAEDEFIGSESAPESEDTSDSVMEPNGDAVGTTVDLSDPAALEVVVLNGGGAGGSAGKISAYLKEKGYTLAKADNASIFTYKNMTVFYADEKYKTDAEKLKEVLSESYDTVEVKNAETDDEKEGDLVVVIGAS